MKKELIFTDEKKEVKIYEDCDCDWCYIGALTGTKTKYEMYICHKCGTECIHRTSLIDGKLRIWNT